VVAVRMNVNKGAVKKSYNFGTKKLVLRNGNVVLIW
jgi:hypothetical protein